VVTTPADRARWDEEDRKALAGVDEDPRDDLEREDRLREFAPTNLLAFPDRRSEEQEGAPGPAATPASGGGPAPFDDAA
jgi:hypothetical protein